MYINKIVCSKCHGLGIIPYYAGIRNGICFKCGGSGLTEERNSIKKDIPNPRKDYNKYIENKKQQGIKNNQIKEIRYKIQELESNLKFNTTDNKKGLINIFKKINKNYTQEDLKAEQTEKELTELRKQLKELEL